ncbi:MAG: hypothetical protein DRR06_11040, partial [Gammaproteobacteria bacterium]
HKVRGSTGSWGAPLGAFQQSNQKRTTYLLQNRTFLFVANSFLLTAFCVLSGLDFSAAGILDLGYRLTTWRRNAILAPG